MQFAILTVLILLKESQKISNYLQHSQILTMLTMLTILTMLTVLIMLTLLKLLTMFTLVIRENVDSVDNHERESGK